MISQKILEIGVTVTFSSQDFPELNITHEDARIYTGDLRPVLPTVAAQAGTAAQVFFDAVRRVDTTPNEEDAMVDGTLLMRLQLEADGNCTAESVELEVGACSIVSEGRIAASVDAVRSALVTRFSSLMVFLMGGTK